jgi:hypothetical protein
MSLYIHHKNCLLQNTLAYLSGLSVRHLCISFSHLSTAKLAPASSCTSLNRLATGAPATNAPGTPVAPTPGVYTAKLFSSSLTLSKNEKKGLPLANLFSGMSNVCL